jgi:hypothetical protein
VLDEGEFIMYLRFRILALLVGIGLLGLLTVPAAADKVDAERIDKLIEQLGSGSFQEREAATKALDAIGPPALDKLRKATQSEDIEVKRRATELVKRIEKRAEASRLLTPKRVHLVYKDTPLKEAVADFKKKSGYNLVLHDPEKKLADRKLTLDTGDTTFWEAFDKFCDKAGVVQVTPQDMMQQMMQEMMKRQQELIKRQNAAPPAPPQKKPGAAPPPPKDEPAPKPEKEAKKDNLPAPVFRPEVRVVKGVGAVQVQVPVQPPAPQAGAGPGGRFGQAMPDFPQISPDQIMLVDGKPKPAPTHYAGTVRVRAAEPGVMPGGQETPLLINLQVSIEPKFQMRGVTAARLTKAVDDNDQTLSQIAPGEDGDGPIFGNVPPGRFIIRGGPIRMGMPPMMGGPASTMIPLKKGDKPSKKLTELTGTLTLQVLDAPEALISVDNILKAGGTTTKGKSGGAIKVVEATKTEDGQIKLQVEIDAPPDVVAADSQGFGGFGMTGGIRLAPGRAILPLPAPPVAAPPAEKPKDEKPKDKPAKEEKPQAKAQAKDKPAAPPAAVPPPVAVPAIAIAPAARQPNVRRGGGYVGDAFNGLSLVDDKGTKFSIVRVGVAAQAVAAGAVATTYEITFEAKKDQGEPVKLIFSGSKMVAVEVPFTLKDVPLQ